jgi:hypothetical protein
MNANGTVAASLPSRRLVFSCGAKGGVGKSTIMVGLTEYYQSKEISVELLDLDNENENKGSLKGWFSSATKIDMRKANAYDVLLRKAFQSDRDVVLADLAAAQGQRVWEWFDTIYASALASGLAVRFTAVAVVTNDPASVEGVLQWGNRLRNKVEYLIVRNQMSPDDTFRAWTSSSAVQEFCSRYSPREIHIGPRDVDFQQITREHGLTLSALASGLNTEDEQLSDPVLRVRAFAYRKELFDQLTDAEEVLLP